MSRTPPPQAIAPHRGIGKLGYDGNMRGIAAVFLVGCTFSGRAEPVGHDALGDSAILSAPCTISVPTGTLGPASLGESASGMNGNPQTPPQCPTGQLPIGAGFDSTANPVFEGGNGGERVVTAVAIQCGTISRDTTGAFTATAGALVGYQANPGGCVIWGPITTAPIVSCPTGSVLVGFTANDGGSSSSTPSRSRARSSRRRARSARRSRRSRSSIPATTPTSPRARAVRPYRPSSATAPAATAASIS